MADFPHLHLRTEINGLFKGRGGGPGPSAQTTTNLQNRQGHGSALLNAIDNLSNSWDTRLDSRIQQELPELPDSSIVPVFLQIDPNVFDVESLKGFGLEIISEEDNGFIIGAALDNFTSLREKINKFLTEQGTYKDKAAQLWQINDGFQWRLEQILSEELRLKWADIVDDEEYLVDVGIACYFKIPDQPELKGGESEVRYMERLLRWHQNKEQAEIRRDEIALDRQTKFEALVNSYDGEIVSSFEDFEDSFACRVKINGKGLKDIALTYQFVFEIVEYDPFTLFDAQEGDAVEINPELIPPPVNAPKVCVIDSGIQEGHRLLAPAIDANSSHSFVPDDNSTADSVSNGGHGTRVAGAILYPRIIPRNGQYQLTCLIQNARVLSGRDGILSPQLYPPELMARVVSRYPGTRIFNMSINSHRACKLVHMSQWASAIDKIMFEQSVLFIASTGNISRATGNVSNPGIKDHLDNNRHYPDYLLEKASRIANPAQSCFALTVGSICLNNFDSDLKRSFGQKDSPSSFTRSGPGLWGMIKPDVVEYGGDFAVEKNQNPNLTYEESLCPELVKSTLGNNGSAIGRDLVGTSFSTPKVSHVVAQLQALFPNENVNFYRVLVAQSARLPRTVFANPTFADIRKYGYGIPDLKRATDNSQQRVTFIASGSVAAKKANVYSVKIPNDLRAPGDEHDILIEVTLAFMARPRRTRRRTQSYLSTWLDWHSSKLNETHSQFCARVIKNMQTPTQGNNDQDTIQWVIRENPQWSKIEGLKRQDSSLQKSWCILKSYLLPQELSIAVVGHQGWSKDLDEEMPYSIAVSFEALASNINIYEMIKIENEVRVEVQVPNQ